MQTPEQKFIRNYKINCEQLGLYLSGGKLKEIDDKYHKQIEGLNADYGHNDDRLDGSEERADDK